MARAQRRFILPSYRDAVLAMNPVGYWRLGEASGTVAYGEMGVNNGAYVNAPTLGVAGLLAGDSDTAVTFNGTNQEVVLPGGGIDLEAGDWTIMAIGRPNSVTGRYTLTGGASGAIRLFFNNTNLAVGCINVADPAGSAAGVVAIGVTLFAGATYVKSSGLLTIYVNGVSAHSEVWFPAWVAGAKNDVIASKSSAGADLFAGTLDDQAWWTRAVTPAEIAEIYRVGMGR